MWKQIIVSHPWFTKESLVCQTVIPAGWSCSTLWWSYQSTKTVTMIPPCSIVQDDVRWASCWWEGAGLIPRFARVWGLAWVGGWCPGLRYIEWPCCLRGLPRLSDDHANCPNNYHGTLLLKGVVHHNGHEAIAMFTNSELSKPHPCLTPIFLAIRGERGTMNLWCLSDDIHGRSKATVFSWFVLSHRSNHCFLSDPMNQFIWMNHEWTLLSDYGRKQGWYTHICNQIVFEM